MKKILVPSDLSKVSEKALKLAVDVAHKTKGQIDLVYFHKHPFGKTFTATGEMERKASEEENIYTLQLIKKYHQELGALAEGLKGDVEINSSVYDEDFDDGVKSYIEENNIDLVIIGTTGEENAKEFFTGNHAQQVIESAPCPVLTVRENDGIGNLEKIVLGVEFKKDAKDNYLRAVSFINGLASDLAAEVHLIHVADNGSANEIEVKLKDFAESHGLINYKIAVVENDSDESGLLSYGHKVNAGAVAVFTHADGGLFRMFDKNLSEEINKHADMPILTINLHRI